MALRTKAAIKADYLAGLKETYPNLYPDGSRALDLAHMAIDNALAGKLRLEGTVWDSVKAKHKIRSYSMAGIAALPDT